jgi:predicted amidohydrolase
MTDHNGKLNLGVWQGAGTPGNVAANVVEIETIAKQAAASDVDLLVFPECFLTGYFSNADVSNIAAKVDAACLETLNRIATECGLTMVVGSYELTETTVQNAALVFKPEIGVIGTYRKQMLYGDWEKRTFRPGTQPLVFGCNGIKVGVLICFDVEFPEKVRQLAQMGAEVLVVPTALMKPYGVVSKALIPTRALENGIYVAYANRIGKEGDFNYVGNSCIVGPDGVDLARASSRDSVLIISRIERSTVSAVRSDISYLDELQKAAF